MVYEETHKPLMAVMLLVPNNIQSVGQNVNRQVSFKTASHSHSNLMPLRESIEIDTPTPPSKSPIVPVTLLPDASKSKLPITISFSKVFCHARLLFLIYFQLLHTYVDAYGRPITIQVDSRYFFDELDATAHAGRRFIPININGHHLICGDASRGATRLLDFEKYQPQNIGMKEPSSSAPSSGNADSLSRVSEMSHPHPLLPEGVSLAKVEPLSSGPGQHWNLDENSWTPESQMMRYLMASKLSYLMEQCFLYKSSTSSYWVFDICVGWVKSKNYGMPRTTYPHNSPTIYGS